MIKVYPRKQGWPDLPHSNSNFSNSHSSSRSIQGILLLQTNTLVLLFHLCLPRLLWLSLLPLAFHFKLQRFSQNMPIIPPQHNNNENDDDSDDGDYYGGDGSDMVIMVVMMGVVMIV